MHEAMTTFTTLTRYVKHLAQGAGFVLLLALVCSCSPKQVERAGPDSANAAAGAAAAGATLGAVPAAGMAVSRGLALQSLGVASAAGAMSGLAGAGMLLGAASAVADVQRVIDEFHAQCWRSGNQNCLLLPQGDLTAAHGKLYWVGACHVVEIDVASGRARVLTGGDCTLLGARLRATVEGSDLYVADRDNRRIVRVTLPGGEMVPLTKSTDGAAGRESQLLGPAGITGDSTNLYVIDNATIKMISLTSGTVKTIAGSPAQGWRDGIGGQALFAAPQGIVSVGSTLYVADTGNHRIRSIDVPTGVVRTLAGGESGMFNRHEEGIGTQAIFHSPLDIDSDGTHLFITDAGNYRVRRILIASNQVGTLAGNGSRFSGDGVMDDASFGGPR